MITIVDYNAGNINSVKRALDYLNVPCQISNDPAEIKNADKIIFPGVGHAAAAMEQLNKSGIGAALKQANSIGTPIFGICLGAQIIFTYSQEGETDCLGFVSGEVRNFNEHHELAGLKIPHMGWNNIRIINSHYLFDGIQNNAEFYFVHSYYIKPVDAGIIAADCHYGIDFPAVIVKDNLVAAQFHPEKSGESGLKMLQNFAAN